MSVVLEPKAYAPPATPGPAVASKRVLAVDDDEYARLTISRHLEKRGYQVVLCSSVGDAQIALSTHAPEYFDCVVTDYLMPQATGVELILWMRQRNPTLASIMVTAIGEKEIVAETLRSGASNFLDKPIRAPELVAAVEDAISQTRRRRDLAKTEADAADVARIQKRMLGQQSTLEATGYKVSHFPMRGAGGDFAAFFPMSRDRLLVVVADVSGHDLRAAFVSAYFQGIVRGMMEKETPVREILDYFNRFLIREWSSGADFGESAASLAVCAAVIDRQSGRVEFHNHGFPPAFLLSPDGRVISDCAGGGAPLGWFEDAVGEEVVLEAQPHGAVMFWTDGLDDHADRLGISPWALASKLLAHEGTSRPEFLEDAPDDILALRIPVSKNAGFRPTEELWISSRYRGDQLNEIDALQAVWGATLAVTLSDWDEERQNEIVLCMREAVINALAHGCRRKEALSMKLEVSYVSSEKCVRVRVEDPGSGHHFDWQAHNELAGDAIIEEHRGLIFIYNLANRVETTRNGASLCMDFASKSPV